MKNILLLMLFVSIFVMSACSQLAGTTSEYYPEEFIVPDWYVERQNNVVPPPPPHISFSFLPLHESLAGFTTDIVIARLVERKMLNDVVMRFEFVVDEVLVGNAEERIFVYIDGWIETEGYDDWDAPVRRGIVPGVDYLLMLSRLSLSPYRHSHIYPNGFGFINDMVIDLTNLVIGDYENTPLAWELPGLDFDAGVSQAQLIAHIASLADPLRYMERYDTVFVESDLLEDIIVGSPDILVVEINEPLWLSSQQFNTNWSATDIFFATVVEVLDGASSVAVGSRIEVEFFADTVSTGERHIVAVTRHEYGWFDFTSRNSLFSTDQIDEILHILHPPTGVTVTAADNATTVQSGDTLQFNAAVAPAETSQTVTWEVSGLSGVAISESGLLSVTSNVPGVITITATAIGTEISGSIDITVTRSSGSGGGWLNIPEPQPQQTTDDEEPEQYLQLIFTVGHRNFLLNGDIRTGVGAPFLDPATDRMMIPLRTVAEAIDANVRWDYDTRSAVIYLPDEILIISVDTPLPDGMGSTIIVYDRAFVPLRFVMEALDANAEWYEPNLQAIITFY